MRFMNISIVCFLTREPNIYIFDIIISDLLQEIRIDSKSHWFEKFHIILLVFSVYRVISLALYLHNSISIFYDIHSSVRHIYIITKRKHLSIISPVRLDAMSHIRRFILICFFCQKFYEFHESVFCIVNDLIIDSFDFIGSIFSCRFYPSFCLCCSIFIR